VFVFSTFQCQEFNCVLHVVGEKPKSAHGRFAYVYAMRAALVILLESIFWCISVIFIELHPFSPSFNPVASTALLRRLSPLKSQRPRTANLHTRRGQSGNSPGVNILCFCRLRPSFSSFNPGSLRCFYLFISFLLVCLPAQSCCHCHPTSLASYVLRT
jgi:hypothetical protein